MLGLYGSFKVPDVERVTLFRDDELPHKFYMLTDKPTILSAEDGTPMLDFISYARNPDVVLAKLKENEPITDLERGHMQVTVGLRVSKTDEQKILAYLRTKLADEAARHATYLNIPVTITEPELSYPPFFVGGSASVNTFNDELQRSAVGTVEPTRSGVCAASFSYDLTQEGAALMLQSMKSDGFPIVARYEGMKFAARIPALKITITGDRSEIFKELHQKMPMGKFHYKGGLMLERKFYFAPPTMGEFRNTIHSLTVTIDAGDFNGGSATDDSAKALEDMALGILEKTILPSFFEPMLEEQDAPEDEKKSSWWLRDEQTSYSGSINLSFTKRDVLLMEHNANGQIGGDLTEIQKKNAVRVLDLSKTNIQFMNMAVFPNLNFETDPIYALQVFIVYDEMDEIENVRLRFQKEVRFVKDSPPQRVSFKLALAADGTPKTNYRYSGILTYSSVSGLQPVIFPRQGGSVTSSAANLIITYPSLGHIKSMITLGGLPDNVLSAEVTVAYVDASIAGATQTFMLDRAHPTAVYLLNTNKQDAEKRYRVSTVYHLSDGGRILKTAQEYTGESVIISSPFEDMLETIFTATGDFSTAISSVSVVARYEDVPSGYKDTYFHTFTQNGEMAKWALRLVEDDKTAFTYDVTVLNKDGSVSEQKALQGKLGSLLTVGSNAKSSLSVMVDAGAVDWNRFSVVYVQLEYAPKVGSNVIRHNIRMAPGFGFEEWRVLIDDPKALTYRRRATFVGKNANDKVDTGFEESQEPFFMPAVSS